MILFGVVHRIWRRQVRLLPAASVAAPLRKFPLACRSVQRFQLARRNATVGSEQGLDHFRLLQQIVDAAILVFGR